MRMFSKPMKFERMNYDIAVTSNTLEHIEQDALALRRITENARTRTTVVLVPAFECLYGTCDAYGGHLRRYRKHSFRRMAESANLTVERISYFNIVGAFAWWLQYVLLRRTDYETESHAQTYSAFDKFVVPVYSRVERILPCPFGLSLVARVSAR